MHFFFFPAGLAFGPGKVVFNCIYFILNRFININFYQHAIVAAGRVIQIIRYQCNGFKATFICGEMVGSFLFLQLVL